RAAGTDSARSGSPPRVRRHAEADRQRHARAAEYLSRWRRREAARVRAPGMTLRELNALAPSHADREFLRCCGSGRWAGAMTAARPFDSLGAMQIRAAAIWQSLDRQDWLEAFAAHPQIGDQGRASAWSATEQA